MDVADVKDVRLAFGGVRRDSKAETCCVNATDNVPI